MIIINRRNPEYKFSFLLFLLTFLIPVSGLYSQSLNYHQDTLQCEYLAKDAEKKYELPENILLSISRVEVWLSKGRWHY